MLVCDRECPRRRAITAVPKMHTFLFRSYDLIARRSLRRQSTGCWSNEPEAPARRSAVEAAFLCCKGRCPIVSVARSRPPSAPISIVQYDTYQHSWSERSTDHIDRKPLGRQCVEYHRRQQPERGCHQGEIERMSHSRKNTPPGSKCPVPAATVSLWGTEIPSNRIRAMAMPIAQGLAG